MGENKPKVCQLYESGEIEKLIKLCADFTRTELQHMGINQSWFDRFGYDMNEGREEYVKFFTKLFPKLFQ